MIGAHGLVLFLICTIVTTARYYCPPANFANNSRRSISGTKSAIIAEIHGQLWAKTYGFGPFWTEYYHGDLLARSLFNHAGVLGIDKMVLGVFYNASSYPNGPTVEDIYPSRKFCVADWYKLGVLDWRPLPFGGPENSWPLDKTGTPTQDRDYYKTLRAYNPFYAEIRNQYDWIFVMDPDEYLNPVNFNVSRVQSDWCSPQHPPLMSQILQQMLAISMRHKLSSYDAMITAFKDKDIMSGESACDMGSSYNEFQSRCTPIVSISMPVYLWRRKEGSPEHAMPVIRSVFPACYADRLKADAHDGQEETWKSVYQTKYSPLLIGRTLHENPVESSEKSTVLAPRAFHGGMSLELIHQRNDIMNISDSTRVTIDRSLISLLDSYKRCMRRLP